MGTRDKETATAAVTRGTIPAGDRLRRLRQGRGLSFARLGGVAGVNPTSIWRAEQSGQISRGMAERLAPALGVAPEELMPKVK
ncbi:MAG: helix-turn-helix domain-containing protein [Anaeromyxobacter sp.]